MIPDLHALIDEINKDVPEGGASTIQLICAGEAPGVNTPTRLGDFARWASVHGERKDIPLEELKRLIFMLFFSGAVHDYYERTRDDSFLTETFKSVLNSARICAK